MIPILVRPFLVGENTTIQGVNIRYTPGLLFWQLNSALMSGVMFACLCDAVFGLPGQSWPPLSGAGHLHCLVFNLNSPVSCGRQGLYSPQAHQSPSTMNTFNNKILYVYKLRLISFCPGVIMSNNFYTEKMSLMASCTYYWFIWTWNSHMGQQQQELQLEWQYQVQITDIKILSISSRNSTLIFQCLKALGYLSTHWVLYLGTARYSDRAAILSSLQHSLFHHTEVKGWNMYDCGWCSLSPQCMVELSKDPRHSKATSRHSLKWIRALCYLLEQTVSKKSQNGNQSWLCFNLWCLYSYACGTSKIINHQLLLFLDPPDAN